MMWFCKLALCALVLCSAWDASAQDTLLMTNGRLKDLRGLVVHFDQTELIWQTVRQYEREQQHLKRTGQTREEFLESELGRRQIGDTASIRLKFEKEIREKLMKLSPEEFEKWKSDELVRMKERQLLAEMGNRRKLTQKRRFTHRMQSGQVFAILHSNGTETLVYSPDTMGFLAIDTTPDLDYSIREMRNYIKGQQDGRRHRTNIDTEVGFVSGMLSAGLGNFYGPIGPAVGMGIQALIPVKIQEKACTNPDLKDNDAYFDGYNQAAKRKKILNYGLGGVLGLGFGFLMYSGLFQ
jgi:hypothetical protein